ncbi:hypothetical protein ACLIKD_08885 [Azonexus sp. IMCC34842]|uniref:hypothetical protein n=1 Tax=Azonexus sp. IMCC34842 TaxID=3420950 RepID=UPI003D0DD8D8
MSMQQTEYRVIVAGQQHFDCATLRATLDTLNCADRWLRAMAPDSERYILCRRCPIGRQHHALHFGEQQAVLQPVRAAVCVRCGRPATRMVHAEICPSCFNRFAEWKKGRNARGNTPIDYVPPVPRRVGIVGDDGAPAWVLFEGQHFAESMARTIRAGLRLSQEQPGRSVWNAERQQFEYVDQDGHVLIALEIDGRLEYISVDQLHPGEQAAQVTMPTMLLTPGDAAVWLTVSGEAEALGADRHQLEFGCARCQQGMLHGYQKQGEIRVECSAGCC